MNDEVNNSVDNSVVEVLDADALLSSHSMQVEGDECTAEISRDNESMSYDPELQEVSDPPQITTAVIDNTTSDDHMPGKSSPSTTNHDAAADQLTPLAISGGRSIGTRFDYVSFRAMIADTSPSGLELTDDNDDVPLPIGNAEAVVANAGEPLKQIGRVEVIEDNNAGPTPPISMLEDSLNAAEKCIKSTSKFINELSPPTPFAEFEDEDDDATVKQKAKEMNKKPAAVSDEEDYSHAIGVDTRGVFNAIQGGAKRRGCGDVEPNDIGGNDEEVDDTIQVDITREEDTAIHIPEAFLVTTFLREVYDATPLEPTLPWHKQRKFVIGGSLAVLLFSAMAVAVGVLVGSQNNNLDEALSAGTSVPPSPSPAVGVLVGSQNNSLDEALGAGTSVSPLPSPIDCSSWYRSPGPTGLAPSFRLTEIVKRLATEAWLDVDAFLGVDCKPQYYLATVWIADEDPMQLPFNDELTFERFKQRYIMALFYYAMDGHNWNNNAGWLGGESECFWFGIDGASEGCGGGGIGGCIAHSIYAGDYDKVCRIAMGSMNNLYGEIPGELGQLSEMRLFEIQDDYMLGIAIPQALGWGWKKIHTILLGGNYLNGGFPTTFINHEALRRIKIDRNIFNGTFPSIFQTLPNLEWLDVSFNRYTGQFPSEIAMLKSLRIFNADNNSLIGTLPDDWDENNLIEYFEVSNNNISGSLPNSLGRAKLMKSFYASGNKLTGQIPTSYFNWENLEELYLDRNELTGELPQTSELFYKGLHKFSIHNNNFKGMFPVENFEGTSRLDLLALHNNQLTGNITSNMCEKDIGYLTADCDLISCSCCICYEKGQLVDNT